MDFGEQLKAGMVREEVNEVAEEHTALHIGSGTLRVLATPWMIAFMERTARMLVGEALPAGYSSVGVHVDVRHLAPAAVGAKVRARAEILSLDGNKVNLSLEAWDEQEKLGEGYHQRVIIDEERFLRRISAKIT